MGKGKGEGAEAGNRNTCYRFISSCSRSRWRFCGNGEVVCTLKRVQCYNTPCCTREVIQHSLGSPAFAGRELPVHLYASFPGQSDTRGNGLLALILEKQRGPRCVFSAISLIQSFWTSVFSSVKMKGLRMNDLQCHFSSLPKGGCVCVCLCTRARTHAYVYL